MKTMTGLLRDLIEGTAASPAVFAGNTFFCARFSGTGVAWRESMKEFALRDKDLWLTDAMCARVCGVPVIEDHPPGTTLNGEEFHRRVVGICVAGFAKGDELWCVIRIVDQRVAGLIDAGDYDTSPAVIFDPVENELITLGNGDRLLIESEPLFLDHLALCAKGVWSKGDPAAVAVETSETVTDKDKPDA